MRFSFSTEAVDLDNQAPNRNKRESRYYWDELYHLIAAGGFEGIGIAYEPKWDFGGRSGIPRTLRSITTKFGTVGQYMEYLRENGISSIDVIHMNPSLFCRGALPVYFGAFGHYAEEAVDFAKQAGCPAVSLSATPSWYAVNALMKDEGTEAFIEKTAELIDTLAGYAGQAGVVFALKNEYWGLLRGEGITAFLDRFEGRVKLDVDTANLAAAGADIPSVIRANKDRIGIVHFTDTAFEDTNETWKTAMPEFPAGRATKVFVDPGEGRVDFAAVLTALKEAGYDGTIVLNPRNSYDVSRSILRCRWFADHII